MLKRRTSILITLLAAWATIGPMAWAQSASGVPLLPEGLGGPQQWTSPEGISSTLQVMLLLTVISLAPAVLLMTTSFIRILVVMGLLRQAIGLSPLALACRH